VGSPIEDREEAAAFADLGIAREGGSRAQAAAARGRRLPNVDFPAVTTQGWRLLWRSYMPVWLPGVQADFHARGWPWPLGPNAVHGPPEAGVERESHT
jgi:hypothetical protein